MPRKKQKEIEDKIQEKLDYIGLDLNKIPKNLTQSTNIRFRTIKGYDEKKYKQYRFIDVNEIEILLSPTNRLDSIKEKYENALPLCEYLDSKNEENVLNYTKFLSMLENSRISQIQEIENEQKKLNKQIPFKIKYSGNYLWQIYYSEVSKKYFMIVPLEDSDYSTFFYLIKKKIENKKDDKIFVPISIVDYSGEILSKSEISDLENYLWVFTKDYPLIYEVYNKKGEMSLEIIGEAEIYDHIKTLYKISLKSKKDALKFYKLSKALFMLQTELPHYYKFEINIGKTGNLEFYLENVGIIYETLPEFIVEQYFKSIGLKKKYMDDIENLNIKLKNLKEESDILAAEYAQKEKQITTYLECKKTFFGKVKYFFKLGKQQKKAENKKNKKVEHKKEENKKINEKIKLEQKNYTIFELENSFKEAEEKEEQAKKLLMDINALKLKNKNLKKKIENATGYIEEINKHKKSIFEFWKYSNKDAVAELDEGEEEELNVKKIEKVFDFENDFENFGTNIDKVQRNKFTDLEQDSVFIANSDVLELLNRMNLGLAENKEISAKLKELKIEAEEIDNEQVEDEETFNIFGTFRQNGNKERTIRNKTHREAPRDKFAILDIKKGSRGIELKKKLEIILSNIKSALEKNKTQEDMYVYKVSDTKLELNAIEAMSLNAQDELDDFIKREKNANTLYLYKIKIPKGTAFAAFTNIIFFDNKNMTLPVGMDLSTKILIDLSKIELKEVVKKKINKLEFEDEEDSFSKIEINIKECE